MIDLKKFPKLGVRVPLALKRRVKQLVLDLENRGLGFDGGEMTMEAVFAVAALDLLARGPEEQAEAFRRIMPDLVAMFEREMPGAPADQGGEGEPDRKVVLPERAPRGKGRKEAM